MALWGSLFSCMPWSCTRAINVDPDLGDLPYGFGSGPGSGSISGSISLASSGSSSPRRARSRSGSAGSTDTVIARISHTELTPYARAQGGSTFRASEAELYRIGTNLFGGDYLRRLAAWSEAGQSCEWLARMECAALLPCMGPEDVLVVLEDGKREFVIKDPRAGSADYDVIPNPRPGDELSSWPPAVTDNAAREALEKACPGWGSGKASGAAADAVEDLGVVALPPLPPGRIWVGIDTLERVKHMSLLDPTGDRIRHTAYLLLRKRDQGLKDISHASVRLVREKDDPSPPLGTASPRPLRDIKPLFQGGRLNPAFVAEGDETS